MKPGKVWLETKNGGIRYFTQFRQIQRGIHKGKIEVTLEAIKERKVIVDAGAIRAYPVEES